MPGISPQVAPPPAPNGAATTPAVTCVLLLSPLRAPDGTWRTHRQAFPPGDVLECYLPAGERLSQVTCNGAIIAPEAYATFRPRPGDEVWLFPRWGIPAAMVPWIIASVVVGLAVSAASHFLFRPKPLLLPQQNTLTDTVDERTFSWDGIRTAIGPGAVVPVIYGTHRIGGQLLRSAVDHAAVIIDDGQAVDTKPITLIQTADQQLVLVTCPNHGFSTGATVLIEGVNPPLDAVNNTWVVTPLSFDTFWLNHSSHLLGAGSYAGGGTARDWFSGVRTYQAITNPPTLSLLLALGEGPIDAILTSTIELNGQPIGNFPGVQIYTGLGEANQPAIAEFGEGRNTYSDGREIPTNGTIITYTSQDNLHAFVLNFVWNAGLYYLNERSEKESNSVQLQYRLAPIGTGTWTAWSTFSVTADRTAPVRLGMRRQGLTYQRYDIQIQFVRALRTDELRAQYQPTLESVTEFIPETYAYPYTALLGLRAVATDQLRGSLPNVTVIVRGRRVRVGTFVPTETWSDNPAWCVMDLLTNTRYGRGVPDSEIDLASFATHAAYCDQGIGGEARHTLNYVLDREQRAQTVFLETMGSSRGLLMKTGGLWTARPTRVETPTALLSWTDSMNVKITYLKDVDAINVMEARFVNQEANYENDVLTWPRFEDWPSEVHKQSLDLRGITKPSRVIREIQYQLNRRRLENMLLEMDCAASAITVQLHDLFRFSHPLPGWGASGRMAYGSTLTTLVLDDEVTLLAGETYVVYVRHGNDAIDVRTVTSPAGTRNVLTLASPLSQIPATRLAMWVVGTLSTDGTMRIFRVTSLQYRPDMTIHLEAVIHNPTIYDDPVGTPLPPITPIFNPLGPPPPLTSLIAMEVTRIQSSGASQRVVNLSWDIEALSTNYAPYGGATILRRSILLSSQAGQVQAGESAFGELVAAQDANTQYVPLAQVRGHVLDFDDYTVITGGSYQYRVVPVSHLGVPNNPGSREVVIHVAGPTTPNYYPATPQNLRLKGKVVGDYVFEGYDIHFAWDPVPYSPLFTDTFFIQDYVVQIWAPGQLYLMHQTTVPVGPVNQSVFWTYTYQQNTEDQIRSGVSGARRDVQIFVWARTNTYLMSLTPATITVNNPGPDMSEIMPEVTPIFEGLIVDYSQWVPPRDFTGFAIYLDTRTPPLALYESYHANFGKYFAQGLTSGVTYYTQLVPHDTFGAGIPSQIASGVPQFLDPTATDKDPPAVPTGLVLTTGSTPSDDGTIVTWVQAAWNANTETDLAGYQVSFRLSTTTIPTVMMVTKEGLLPPRTSVRLPQAPGNVTVFCKMLAYDNFFNASAYTDPEISITTAVDTVPPAAPPNLFAFGSIRSVALLWTPPSDPDYVHAQVWVSQTNDRGAAVHIGHGYSDFVHESLGANDTRYYWVRSVDSSGNLSPTFFPASATAGIVATAGQLDTTFIANLAANKIIAGTIQALVRLGVGNQIDLDGVNQAITVRDGAGTVRALIGKLGPLSSQWGMLVYNSAGALMFSALDTGVTAAGIQAGVIQASHLRTDVAVITVAAQIANAIINDAAINNLSASKIIAGTIQALVSIGVSGNAFGSNIFLDGVNRHITVYDEFLGGRVRLGKLGAGFADYGMTIWNQAGQEMWNFNSGSSTLGIQDLAVTNAKIANLSASKIATGKISVGVAVGESGNAFTSNIFLDGVNSQIAIYDDQATPMIRCLMGKHSAGFADYGLRIWNQYGQLMYDFVNGAQTPGIAPHAVTASILFSGAGGGLVAGTETEFASVTWPSLNAGDQMLLLGTGTISVDSANTHAIMHLREDNTSGTLLHTAYGHAAPSVGTFSYEMSLTVQAVFTAGSALTSKRFVVSLTGPALSGAATVSFVKLATVLLQR